MSTLAWVIGLVVIVALVAGLAWRYGIPPGGHFPGQAPYYPPLDTRDDHETGGFKTDFGPKRERPPTDENGPGWDS